MGAKKPYEPYENTLTIDELREEVRRCWDEKAAFDDALINLPAVPPTDALRVLEGAAMNGHRMPVPRTFWEIGKALQREHGLDLIPPKSEYENAAGLWSVIREALLKP